MKPTPEMIEAAARAIVNTKTPEVASDEWWSKNVEHYREMCASFPAYAKAHSLITDAFRDAEAALSAALSVQPAEAVVGEPVAWTTEANLESAAYDPELALTMWGKPTGKKPVALYREPIAAPSAPDGWQPIETAPDEGVFLVWCGFFCFGYIGYHQGEKRWYDSDALEGGNYIRVRPTHWRPLPAPPALGGKP